MKNDSKRLKNALNRLIFRLLLKHLPNVFKISIHPGLEKMPLSIFNPSTLGTFGPRTAPNLVSPAPALSITVVVLSRTKSRHKHTHLHEPPGLFDVGGDFGFCGG